MENNNANTCQQLLGPGWPEAAAAFNLGQINGPGYWPEPAWAGLENPEGGGGMNLKAESMLPKIEGIGVAAAMFRLGRSFGYYLELLQLFVRNVEENHVLLETIPSRLNLPSFTAFMLSLKTDLTAIGAKALSELASMLEAAGINEDISVIRDNIPLFRMGLAALTAHIGETIMALRSDIASSALLREDLEPAVAKLRN
ncbi:MAG: hypothetical protein FWG97_01030 [Deltaproteobacteria bacterium]|nr:hypothetical protein [Deltaproteobacteria bacterium]